MNKIFIKLVSPILNFYVQKILQLKVVGQENFPLTGAVIVAPNHKSNWDPPVVGVAIQHRIVHYMAKEELFKNPIFAWVLRQFGAFPVKRGHVDNAAIRQAMRELKAGNALGIFPEGTRVKKDGVGPFHSGMASLALLTGTPIVPIAVIGSRDLPQKRDFLCVSIGKPIPVKKEKVTKEKIQELNNLVKKEILVLMKEQNVMR